jgi:MSHA pilin protein MshA
MKNKPQTGFTLIELIIVIVILGILAVTAVPRFIDISTDANIAILSDMRGKVDSAAQLVFAKSVIQGIEKSSSAFVDINGDGNGDIRVRYGYPASSSDGIIEALGLNVNSADSGWAWAARLAGDMYFSPAKLSEGSGDQGSYLKLQLNCRIIYYHPNAAGDTHRLTGLMTTC